MAALPSMTILLYAEVLASVLVLLFKKIIVTGRKTAYSYFWHPLRHVPGPFIAKLTSKWLSYRDITGTRTASLHELHQVYGPVVRAAPDELSFADSLAIKEIYGQGTPYMKSPFYDGMHLGTPNLFDGRGRDRAAHKERRKLLSHAFARSSINDAEPLIADQIGNFLAWVEKKEGSAMNVYAWFRMLTLDITTCLFMGEAIGALDVDAPHEYLSTLDNHLRICGLKWQMPYLLPLTSWVPIKTWQHFLASPERLYAYGHRAFGRYIERFGRDSERNDLLKNVIRGDATVAPLDDEAICSELASLIMGGTDTTSTTLTYLAWELAKHPQWQTRFREELQLHNVKFHFGVPDYESIEGLEILNAIVSEGLRLHPATPASLLRVVPPQGARITGIFVPGGTTISMQSYTTHHNATAFPDPDKFDPSRWLTVSGGTATMKEAYMPFSKGSRGCMGIHLATMTLKLIVSALVHRWDIHVGEKTTEDTMSMTDHFVLMPKGGFCELVFKEVGR